MNFKKKIKPQNSEKKQKKKYVLQNLHALLNGRPLVLDASESKIFPIKIEVIGFSGLARVGKVYDRQVFELTRGKFSDHSNLKILRLTIALTQVKAGNTSENLLNEIIQIISSLYRSKDIIKKSI